MAGKSMSPSCEICVLAGGLSSRMGSDKAGVRIGGKTMLWHIQRAVEPLALPFRVIRRDTVPRCGPLGGCPDRFAKDSGSGGSIPFV